MHAPTNNGYKKWEKLMNEYKIKEEQQNIRLDKIISELEQDISRTTIQRMIDEGYILVNGKKVKTSYKVVEGDLINIQDEEPQETDLVPQDIPLNIIYEDDDKGTRNCFDFGDGNFAITIGKF